MPAKASWEAKAVFDAPQITHGPTRLEVKRLTVMLVTFSLLGLGVASAIADTHVELHASLSGAKSFPHAHGSSTFERNDGARDVDITVCRWGRTNDAGQFSIGSVWTTTSTTCG